MTELEKATTEVIKAAELLNNWNVTMAQAADPNEKLYRKNMRPAERRLDEAFQRLFQAQQPCTDQPSP